MRDLFVLFIGVALFFSGTVAWTNYLSDWRYHETEMTEYKPTGSFVEEAEYILNGSCPNS